MATVKIVRNYIFLLHFTFIKGFRPSIIDFIPRLNVPSTNEMLVCWPATLSKFQSIMHVPLYFLAATKAVGIVNVIATLNVLSTAEMLLCLPVTLGQFQSVVHLLLLSGKRNS